MCLWNCNSGRTRLKILHMPNNLRAFVPFKISKCMHLGNWSLQLLMVTGAHSPVPDCGIAGPLFSNAHFYIWKVRCQISVACVTPSPGASVSGVLGATEGVKIRWSWPCCYTPKELFCFFFFLQDGDARSKWFGQLELIFKSNLIF